MTESGPRGPASKQAEIRKIPAILDGKEAKDLMDSVRTFEFASGEIVIAGTHKGITRKNINEDRIVADPVANFLAVVDGVGSSERGEVAAEILAKNLSKFPNDVAKAFELSIQEMKNLDMTKGDGAVFISAVLRTEGEKKFLDIRQAGDARLLVIKRDGTVHFQSRDETWAQMLVDAKQMTPDKALHDEKRHTVLNLVSFSEDNDNSLISYPPLSVEKGDVVFLMSDGISDNITTEKIVEKVKEGLSAHELFNWLSTETNQRMQNAEAIIKSTSNREKDGVYSDGHKSEPKQDNLSLAIMEIK